MIKPLISLATVLALAAPLNAQDEPQEHPSPNQIVAEASSGDWMSIPAEDLLVMTLAPDAEGNERKVVIQLMPVPFSQGWVENIRTLARAIDGLADDVEVVQADGDRNSGPDSLEISSPSAPWTQFTTPLNPATDFLALVTIAF